MKTKLLILMVNYKASALDPKKYMKLEAEIMASLSKLTKQVKTPKCRT